jgi:hypothetical protein
VHHRRRHRHHMHAPGRRTFGAQIAFCAA